MSKYLGPRLKKLRALGLPLPKFRNKGSNPPGQHGEKRKKKKSSYGLQLQEKQKIKLYGLRDKQLRNEYVKAKLKAGNVGVNLLISSESRLDNLVFKSGIVNTVGFARQWVNHKHFLVDGKNINIPSYKVKPGQVISLKKEEDKENKLIKNVLEQNIKTPPYVNLDREKLTISYLRYPLPEELNKDINTSLVVEWWNRRV